MTLEESRQDSFRRLAFSIPWNLALITVGSWLVAFAVKAVILPQNFIAGGMGGLALLAYYVLDGLTPGLWYFALNVPVFLLGWLGISRRFFLYSLYGMAAVSVCMDLITVTVPLADKWLAVLVGGGVLGVGVGVALRSLGSTGGVDILMVWLHQRYGVRMGLTDWAFNAVVFLASLFWLRLDDVLYSLAMLGITAWAVDLVVGLFSERKAALIISERPDEVCQAVLTQLDRGATLLPGQGGFTREPRKVILVVVNNIQLKRLEELVYGVDPAAFTVVLSTANVIGRGFSSRKVY